MSALVLATMLIGALSVAVWAHHMFVTGAVNLPFFSFMTFLIAVPTGVKFFNWIGTMWGGNIAMRTPMLWAVGFLTTFLFGGLTGIVLASPPLDFAVSDSYFVVAHFHYVVFGTVVFAMFAGYLLLVAEADRQDAGRDAGQDPLLAALHRIPRHVPHPALAGRRGNATPLCGLPAQRRFHPRQPDLLGRRVPARRLNAGLLLERLEEPEQPEGDQDDPWGWGRSLEWATTCPPPRHNFTQLPKIRSESPAFDLHHPEVALLEYGDAMTRSSTRQP